MNDEKALLSFLSNFKFILQNVKYFILYIWKINLQQYHLQYVLVVILKRELYAAMFKMV